MAADTVAFPEEVVGRPAHLFGHSAGAPVGLLVAQRRPDLVTDLVTGLVVCEGVFHHDGWKPGVLDPLPADVEEFLGDLHAMHEALPRAQPAIVPGTGHGLPADKPDLCARLITDFADERGR